ncbi:MAG: sugar phosphate isomerase/epimerase family protein [Armatimonadota bacterium]
MKIGMNLLLWTAGVTEEHFPLLARLKEIGFDGVELPLFEGDEAGMRRVGAELDNLGLGRTAVTVCTPETNPISPDPAVRRAAVDTLKQRIDLCRAAGAELLCGPFHSALGAMQGRGRTDEEWAWCVEVQREAAQHARDARVKLSVEPLNRFEVYFLNTAADADRLVREVDVPGYGYLYDSFHANIEERDVRESITANAAGINHVHISENHRGVPGEGHVRWEETFQGIRDCGYDGWLTIEAFGSRLPELAAATCIWRPLFDSEEELARRGLEHIRRHVA